MASPRLEDLLIFSTSIGPRPVASIWPAGGECPALYHFIERVRPARFAEIRTNRRDLDLESEFPAVEGCSQETGTVQH